MISLVRKKHRRHVLELQLTAMIDIFSLIVIFLIKGTVFGVSDVAVPTGVKLPKSSSTESLESAPTAQVTSGALKLSMDSRSRAIPLDLLEESGQSADVLRIRKEIEGYISRLSNQARSSGVLVSIIADRTTPYSDIFRAIKFLRRSGFESMLFIAADSPEVSR